MTEQQTPINAPENIATVDQVQTFFNTPAEPVFAPELVDFLAECGYRALRDHLAKTNAPPAALQLVESLQLVELHKNAPATASSNEWMTHAVGDLTKAIKALGGYFEADSRY